MDVNEATEETTALVEAVLTGRTAMVGALLDAGTYNVLIPICLQLRPGLGRAFIGSGVNENFVSSISL